MKVAEYLQVCRYMTSAGNVVVEYPTTAYTSNIIYLQFVFVEPLKGSGFIFCQR